MPQARHKHVSKASKPRVSAKEALRARNARRINELNVFFPGQNVVVMYRGGWQVGKFVELNTRQNRGVQYAVGYMVRLRVGISRQRVKRVVDFDCVEAL